MLLNYCWTLRLLLIFVINNPEVNILVPPLDTHVRLVNMIISVDEFLDRKFLDQRIFVLKKRFFSSITVLPFRKAVAVYTPACSAWESLFVDDDGQDELRMAGGANNIYWVLCIGHFPGCLHGLSHLILKSLWSRYVCCSHLTEEETGSEKSLTQSQNSCVYFILLIRVSWRDISKNPPLFFSLP